MTMIRYDSYTYLTYIFRFHVAGSVVGQALDSKSSVTELCLADNELGLGGKGAMLAMRKAGSDVQGVNGKCGETNMAFMFPVFAFGYSNSQETNFFRRAREGC